MSHKTSAESNVESITSWYGLNFRSVRIPDLPRQLRLGKVASDLYELDYAKEEDERACWEIIGGNRERGDNVAVDQCVTEDELRFHLRFSVPFTLRKVKAKSRDENINALVVIHPSIYARSVDACLAHIRIYRSEAFPPDQDLYDDLLRLAVIIIPQLGLGYTRCIANVPSVMTQLVTSYRSEGFVVVATIPDGVKLNRLGTCDDLLMSKTISPSRPRRPTADIELLCSRYATEASEVLQSLEHGDGMLPMPFLPKPYVFENGQEIIVRPLKFCESAVAYDVWRSAASKGQGYGLDECPTLEMFQLIMLADHYCIAFDDAVTSELVGLTFITDSWYKRNPDLRHGETSLFLTEKYRGRGLGPESTHIGLLLLKQLGYTATLNDTLLSNSQMFKALKRSPLPPVAVGVIPDGTYTAGRGWDDQVILLADYGSASDNIVQDFLEASEKSLERRKTAVVAKL